MISRTLSVVSIFVSPQEINGRELELLGSESLLSLCWLLDISNIQDKQKSAHLVNYKLMTRDILLLTHDMVHSVGPNFSNQVQSGPLSQVQKIDITAL